MSSDSPRLPKLVRVERHGAAPALATTIDERIEQVWALTLECLAWRKDGAPPPSETNDEPRLRRAVGHVRRP